jgi:hypothetical protein
VSSLQKGRPGHQKIRRFIGAGLKPALNAPVGNFFGAQDQEAAYNLKQGLPSGGNTLGAAKVADGLTHHAKFSA